MPPRESKRTAAPVASTQKALATAREQQQSRGTASGEKAAWDARRLVVYAPERLLIWQKRTRMKLMARRKYEPYAWSSETSRRRMQRDETAPSGLWVLDSTLATMGEPSYLLWKMIFTSMSLLLTAALLICCCCCCCVSLQTSLYSDTSQAETVRYKFVHAGVVLLLLLLLLLLRFCTRRAKDGVVLQMCCCCDFALVLS